MSSSIILFKIIALIGSYFMGYMILKWRNIILIVNIRY